MNEPVVISVYNFLNAIFHLQQVVRLRIQELFDSYGYGDITMEMAQLLYLLELHGGEKYLNQQMIADELGKSKSSITSLIDNLVKRQMVKRSENPDSRRNNAISLSKKGLVFVSDIYPKINKIFLDETVRRSENEFRLLLQHIHAVISDNNDK